MKKYTLTAREDRETGDLGYMVDGTPFINYPMVATEGVLVAHDILEHVNGVKSIGSLDDELMALAGVWYIRGQWGELRKDGVGSRYTPEDNLASDVLNMALIYNNGVDFRTPVPKTKSHSMDETFKAIICKAKQDVSGELDSEDRNQGRLNVYFDACLHYMRAGYNKIARKWDNALWMNTIFWRIAEALNPWMSPEYEGQKIELSFSLTTGLVSVDEFYGDEW